MNSRSSPLTTHRSPLIRGMTVMEVLVALSILALALYFAYAIFYTAQRAQRTTGKRLQMQQGAQNVAERLRASPLSTLPPETLWIGPPDFAVQLAHKPILPDSVTLCRPDGAPIAGDYTVDAEEGKITFTPPSDEEQRNTGWVTAAYTYRHPLNEEEDVDTRRVSVEVRGEYLSDDLTEVAAKKTGVRRFTVTVQTVTDGREVKETTHLLRTE